MNAQRIKKVGQTTKRKYRTESEVEDKRPDKLDTTFELKTPDRPMISGDPFKYGSHNVRKIIKRGKSHIRKLSKPQIALHPF